MATARLSFALFAVLALAACTTPAPENPPAEAEPAPTMSDEGSADEAPAAEGSAAEVVEPEPEPEPEPTQQELIRAEIAGHGPIEGPAYELIWGVTPDDAPEMLNATREDLENRHYLTCDELNLHIWYEQVKDIGGAYAGVGSDQAYTFIGWMKPQVAWLTDYDPWVRTVHKIYRLAFERADTIEEFRAFWHEDNADESWAAIEARWSEDSDFRLMESVWNEWRYKINRRLRRYQRVLRDAEIPSFLTDEETYTWVRDFTLSGRVRPILANLLDDTGLRGVGEASRELDVPIRVFYLSNAEDYWRYPDNFRENFRQLHFDEESLILRTNATKRRNGDYRYAAQPALNFREWLNQDYVSRIDDIWLHPRVDGEDHIPYTFIDQDPVDRGGR